MRDFFKKNKKDIIVLGVLLLIGLAGYFILNTAKQPGAFAEVRVDGESQLKLPLSAEGTYEIEGYNGGRNVLCIKDGTAQMTEADCPDGLCIHMGKISAAGQSIICLPHRVVVEIMED